MERYFAWLLLSQCESQTSLKLVIRSYDRRPYLLVIFVAVLFFKAIGGLFSVSRLAVSKQEQTLRNRRDSVIDAFER